MKSYCKSDGTRSAAVSMALFFLNIGVSQALEQTWRGGEVSAIWSTNAANWEGEAVWINGSSAVFDANTNAIFKGMVDVAATVTVANVTFQTNGYTIADADNNGSLSVVGAPSVITVVNAGDTGTVSEAIAGSGGFTKAGNGLLNLTATNTFTGVLRVSSGVLRLNTGVLYALGAVGAGNETIVENGATLNFNGAYTNSTTTENISISGVGVDGLGVLVNTGASFMNSGFGTLTLLGNSTLGCITRIDIRNPVAGNGYTLTKSGSSELAVGNAVTNCAVVINAGNYTYMNGLALGTSDYDTTLNGGQLRSYGSYTLTERISGNGGTIIAAGSAGSIFNIAGRVLLNSNVFVSAENNNTLEVSGLLEGAGGITRSGSSGLVQITGNTNTYAGPTTITGVMWVGKTNLYSGVLGFGTVTNQNTLYNYSPRMCQGNLVNLSTLYCTTGSLVSGASSLYNSGTLYWNGGVLGGTGAVTNNNYLYIDRGGAFVSSNGFFGSGLTALRYGGRMTIDGSVSSNSYFRIGNGTLTLTNGADFCVGSELSLADRQVLNYPIDPSNITSTVNIMEGSTLRANEITIGNGGGSLPYVSMTGTINQVGGTVRTTGSTQEGNGIRLGHYPAGHGIYNMSGGKLTIEKDWDLCIATDGTGWFNMTGGEVFATRVMLNERSDAVGFGKLTVSGGVMNLGSLSGLVQAISNGIAADPTAPYLVEYGGAGGVIRAMTNIYSSLNATLYATNANAITFDSTNFTITLSGKLSGAGGLNKTGSGRLVLSGTNTYSGATRVLEGQLTPASDKALPAGGVVEFGVSADGSGGQLYVPGDLSLSGLIVGVANPEVLDEHKNYTIATYGGVVTGSPSGDVLPGPWYVYRDVENKRVQLRAAIGTMIRVR